MSVSATWSWIIVLQCPFAHTVYLHPHSLLGLFSSRSSTGSHFSTDVWQWGAQVIHTEAATNDYSDSVFLWQLTHQLIDWALTQICQVGLDSNSARASTILRRRRALNLSLLHYHQDKFCTFTLFCYCAQWFSWSWYGFSNLRTWLLVRRYAVKRCSLKL